MDVKEYVLLIDDNDDFLDTISFWLNNKGYKIRIARDGQSGLDMIKEQEPDLVFLDINMPGIDGIEVLRRIRETNKGLPVVMVTAVYTDKRLEEAKKLGISGFFPKECDLDQLVNILQVAIRRHR